MGLSFLDDRVECNFGYLFGLHPREFKDIKAILFDIQFMRISRDVFRIN